jgi:hypothetical protein
MMSTMSTMNPYDHEQQAQAAMRKALAATGDDKQKWVRIALAWWHLARIATDNDRALSSEQHGLPRAGSIADSLADSQKSGPDQYLPSVARSLDEAPHIPLPDGPITSIVGPAAPLMRARRSGKSRARKNEFR